MCIEQDIIYSCIFGGLGAKETLPSASHNEASLCRRSRNDVYPSCASRNEVSLSLDCHNEVSLSGASRNEASLPAHAHNDIDSCVADISQACYCVHMRLYLIL